MMPLCTTTISPVQSRCGWAFSSVGRPCVAQRVWPIPYMPSIGRFAEHFFEVVQLPGSAANFELSVFADNRDSRGIVATVFKPMESVENEGNDFFRADIADNSAHSAQLPLKSLGLSLRAFSQFRLAYFLRRQIRGEK